MRRSNKVVVSPIVVAQGSLTSRAIEFAEKYCILPASRLPIELHKYQRDLFEDWSSTDTKAHVTVIGAGNAKTSTLAAYVTAMLYLTDEADIPVVAATVRQAWYTTAGVAKRFVELNPELACRAEILEGQGSRSGIYVDGTGGHLYPIADNPAGLQGLAPSIAVLEEMSEATMLTFGALMNRLGKRVGSKLIGISTPSFTLDNALMNIQNAAHSGNPMPGVVVREYISDQKDHRDESKWHISNPGIATDPPVLDIEAIRTDLAVLPEMQFRAYRLCQNPTGSASCWLNSLDDQLNETGDSYDLWKSLEYAYQFVDGAATYIGVDASKSDDHTAVVSTQFREDGTLHAKCKIFEPTAYGTIDLEDVAIYLRQLCGMYDVRGIHYDPSYFYNAPALDKEGLPMVICPPTLERMVPVCRYAYSIIRQKRVSHDGNPEFTKHVLAAKRKYAPKGNGWTIEKSGSAKIDAAIGLILAINLALPPVEKPKTDFSTVKF